MKICCELAKQINVIRWNELNAVVQCHGCGTVYKAKVKKFKFNLDLFSKKRQKSKVGDKNEVY